MGHPPFETTKLTDTYARIKNNEYNIPSRLSNPARRLIELMLRANPAERPSMRQILAHEFFTNGIFVFSPHKLQFEIGYFGGECNWGVGGGGRGVLTDSFTGFL